MRSEINSASAQANPKAILSFFLLTVFFLNLPAQTKKDEAEVFMGMKNYPAALAIYESFYKNNPLDGELNLHIAMCKFYMKHLPPTIYPYLLKAKEQNQVESWFYLGQLFHLEQRLEEEISNYQRYRNTSGPKKINDTEIARLISIAKRAQEMMDKPVTFSVENIGTKINTANPEYAPALSLDEKTMLFTSRRPGNTGKKKDISGNYFEDILTSQLENGVWTDPQNIGSPINTDGHDASACLSVDGNNLVIFRTDEGNIGGDLYLSVKQNKLWGTPVKLPVEVNSEFLELSASMAADNQTIYFSSNRTGGYGGLDIYRVVKLPDGKWSSPLNLGPTINTPQDEDAPFIHPDGQTLFFSSTGHSTMGGYDIFRSEMQYDGMWIEPLNLGYPINSVAEELYFVLSVDGKNGYFSSDRSGGQGERDLYKVDINYNQPSMKVVSGYLRDIKDPKIVLKGLVRMIDESNRIVPNAVYSSDSRTGKFIAICNPKFKYKMIVETENYHPVIMDVVPALLKNDDGSLLVDMSKK